MKHQLDIYLDQLSKFSNAKDLATNFQAEVPSETGSTGTTGTTGATGATGGGAFLASSSPPNCVDEAGQSPLFDPQHGNWWSRCKLPACECFPAFSCEWKLGWEAPYCPVATAHCLSSGRSPVQQVSRFLFN